MIEEMGLSAATPLGTAGADEKKESGKKESDDEETSPELGAQAASQYRGLAARANYVSQDRADIQFATKELCRCMSKPTEASWAKLKRLVRYLCGRPRAVARFHWQDRSSAIDVYSDANWAGCRASRKSNSGGAVLWGGCCFKSYSKTQNTVAQSSAEPD